MSFIVFLSAFRGERNVAQNTAASAELATVLIQQHRLQPEVVVGFYPENGAQTVTFEQSYAVRTDTDGVNELAKLACQGFQQECILAVNASTKEAYYVDANLIWQRAGIFTRSDEIPDGARSQWRGAWWFIDEEAL